MQKVSLIPHELPYEVNEQFKYLRTNLQFCGAENKVIMFTSSIPSEGKSSTVLELAKSMAEFGKRVLLVDADLRRSMLRHKTTAPKEIEHGLTHYLSGLAPLKDVIYETDDPMLNIIFAGPVPPNPSELLSANRLTPLLDWARSKYDYIFVDTAPLTAVIDAGIVAGACDGAVIIIEAEKIPYRMVQSVVMQLRNSACPILGVVLNKVNAAARHKRYGSMYHYYRYYNRYGYYKKYGYQYKKY